MLMVQTLETTSGRKWTENTANVAKRLNVPNAVAENEGCFVFSLS